MTFDVVVGNPPFNEAPNDSSPIPLYNRFVLISRALGPRHMAFIIPARWYCAGKPQLDDFRAEMLGDRRLVQILDYLDENLFPGATVVAGFCVFWWASDHDGDCLIVPEGDWSRATPRRLDELGVFIRDPRSMGIVRKVLARMRAADLRPVSERLWSLPRPFGYMGHEVPRDAARAPSVGRDVLLMTKEGDRYIRRDQVLKRADAIDLWKVAIGVRIQPFKGIKRTKVFGIARILAPREVCTGTYMVIDAFDEEVRARNTLATLQTRFCRFMLTILAPTQNTSRKCYLLVPAMPTDRVWTDGDLVEFFDLSEADVGHINSRIQ